MKLTCKRKHVNMPYMRHKPDGVTKDPNPDLDLDVSLDFSLDLDFGLEPKSEAQQTPGGTLEEDFREELSDAAKAIKAYYKQSYDRQKQITDSGYYFCVCFQTGEQCRQFLDAVGWEGKDEAGARFLNGLALARRLGVKLEKTTERPKRMPTRPRFLDHVMEVEKCDEEEKINERFELGLPPAMPVAVRSAQAAEPTRQARKARRGDAR